MATLIERERAVRNGEIHGGRLSVNGGERGVVPGGRLSNYR